MKKVLLLIAAMVAFSSNVFADVDPYVVDDDAIDALFAEATEVTASEIDAVLSDIPLFADDMSLPAPSFEDRTRVNPWKAWLICSFLGSFGIHRHHMGTRRGMWAIYTFTCCGIFGYVVTIDWFILLINAIKDGDIRKYCNNDRYFMWL